MRKNPYTTHPFSKGKKKDGMVKRTESVVKVTGPARIDLSGGWSDTPPICFDRGGTVTVAGVTLNGRQPIEALVKRRKQAGVLVCSRDLKKRRVLKTDAEIRDHSDPHDWCALVKAALAVTGFEFGSRGIDITLSSDLPKGSGIHLSHRGGQTGHHRKKGVGKDLHFPNGLSPQTDHSFHIAD